MKFVILTGMSGAGKSTALKMMEDIGFYCVDNLPIPLLEKFVELSDLQQNAELQKVAVGIDIRSGQALEELRSVLDRIKANGGAYDILFLDAEDSVLVKRYKETRRSHPLAGSERVDKGIAKERERLAFLKERASYIIDTSQLLTRELKAELDKIFVQDQKFKNLMITVLSFGCLSRFYRSDLNMESRRIPIWFSMCVFCRIHITWKGFVPRQEMTRKFRIMCFNLRRRTSFWIN